MKEGSETDGTKEKEPASAAPTSIATVAPTAVIVNHNSLHHSDSNSSTGSASANNQSNGKPGSVDDVIVNDVLATLRTELSSLNPANQPAGTGIPSPKESTKVTKPGGNGLTTEAPDSASREAAPTRGNGSGTPREKAFVCNICDRCFGYKHVLQNHQRTHTGEKPFQCYMCMKRFTRDHHLKTHMRLHTGEKPYHCTQCERKFVQVANLRRHLRVHTGERPYACGFCTSRFSDSNQLKAHVLIHKGEKPFQCKKCLGRFRRRHHLMHHKCPKDEANLGKPRRGRRPKAYDDMPSTEAISNSEPYAISEKLQPETIPSRSEVCSPVAFPNPAAAAAVLATTTAFLHLPPQLPTLPIVPPPPVVHKSRRKPPHTIRILTPQQRQFLLSDTDTIQTQPLDMSVNPSSDGPLDGTARASSGSSSSSSIYVPSPTEGVLDLSNSRSDSEPEAIEEEVEADDIDEEEDDELEGPVDGREGYDYEDDVVHNLRSTRLQKHPYISIVDPRDKEGANRLRSPRFAKDGNGHGSNGGGLPLEREKTNGIIRLAKSPNKGGRLVCDLNIRRLDRMKIFNNTVGDSNKSGIRFRGRQHSFQQGLLVHQDHGRICPLN